LKRFALKAGVVGSQVSGSKINCIWWIMTVRSRQTRFLLALFVSILAGGAILNTLSHNPLSASAFCLSQYYHLAPVEESVGAGAGRSPQRWRQIEIHYGVHGDSRTQREHGSGKFPGQSSSAPSAMECRDNDCHFVICDGYLGPDGQIQTTENWQSQSAVPYNTQDRPAPSEDGQTIHICISTESEDAAPTDFQISRIEALVEELCRRFRILPEAIRRRSI